MDEGLDESEVDYGDLPPSMDLEEVLILYRHLLVHLGVRSRSQMLGEGERGAVFVVGPDGAQTAVKLTEDVDEAIASAHLVNNPCKHVVRIRRVAALPDTARGELAQWFVIERELLELPPERDKRILRVIWETYEETEDLMVPTGRAMLSRWREALRLHLHAAELKRAIWMLTSVGRGAQELGRLGLEWSDLHDENVMRRRGGPYVIADPGPGVVTGWRSNRPIEIPAFRANWRPRSSEASVSAATPS